MRIPFRKQARRVLLVLFPAAIIAVLIATGEHNARSDTPVSRALELSEFGQAGVGGDDTGVFQTALNAAAASRHALHVAVSPVPYQVQPLYPPSHTRLVLDAGVIIQATPGYTQMQKLINLENVSDIEILGPGAVLRMRPQEYTSGEYRHCIEMQGVTNAVLKGISCNDSGGDGLYIGPGNQGFSHNIFAQDCRFFHNRRQGMSITSAIGVRIQRCYFENTKGTPGESGIDIEPNTAAGYIRGIQIEDSVTNGNNGDGLSINLASLGAASPHVDITVLRHHSSGNGGSGFTASYETNGNVPGVAGSILIDSGTSQLNAAYGAVASFYSGNGPTLTFRNLYVVDANQKRTTYDNAAIAIKRGGGGIGRMGNVSFLNPTIIDTTRKLDYYFTLRDYSNLGFVHVQVSPLAGASGAAHAQPLGLVQGQAAESVSIP